MTLEKPNIMEGDFSIEFWMKVNAGMSGLLFNQEGGLQVEVNRGVLSWTFGGKTFTIGIAADGAFYHYTLSYSQANNRMRIYQDDLDLGSLENSDIGMV